MLFLVFTTRKLMDTAAKAMTASYFEGRPCRCVVVPPFLATRFYTATVPAEARR